MSELESIGKLREWSHRYDNAWSPLSLSAYGDNYGEAIRSMIDEIEAEIVERYIELPVDADGVPIRVGEDVVRTNDRLQPEVVRVIGVSGGSVFFKHEGRVKQNVAHNLHHVKPRTLESVLADLANEVWEASCTCQTTWSDSGLDGIEKKYADEIRELMEAER